MCSNNYSALNSSGAKVDLRLKFYTTNFALEDCYKCALSKNIKYTCIIGGKREGTPYLNYVYGSRVCTYIRPCLGTCPLIMRTSGAYSPCDSYACTCAVVTATHVHLAKIHR